MTSISQENTVKLIERREGYLSITFAKVWYQEDISRLVEHLLLPIIPINIQEKNIGADREDIRFSWDNHFFVLNFDFYSQSCWIEGQDYIESDYLEALYSALS